MIERLGHVVIRARLETLNDVLLAAAGGEQDDVGGFQLLGLARLAEASGSKIVGIGALIEKDFEGGRAALASLGVPIESIACIKSLDNGKIEFVD